MKVNYITCINQIDLLNLIKYTRDLILRSDISYYRVDKHSKVSDKQEIQLRIRVALARMNVLAESGIDCTHSDRNSVKLSEHGFHTLEL